MAVDMALRKGRRGMPGGSSLSQLLAERRGVDNATNCPKLTVKKILNWIDDHHSQTGQWPNSKSGHVRASPHETWQVIDLALKRGYRGLRVRTSLAKLLKRHRASDGTFVCRLSQSRAFLRGQTNIIDVMASGLHVDLDTLMGNKRPGLH